MQGTISGVRKCEGGDAEISITHQGGVSPFTYKWNTGHTTKKITGKNLHTLIENNTLRCTPKM